MELWTYLDKCANELFFIGVLSYCFFNGLLVLVEYFISLHLARE